jgi:hypothetical protein
MGMGLGAALTTWRLEMDMWRRMKAVKVVKGFRLESIVKK